MSFVISPAVPFPDIAWFQQVVRAGTVMWDGKEHFAKLSFRNRYYIATAAGPLTLSIPLQHGRDQRNPMEEVSISYDQAWQQQHWRTLIAAYGRSPYFGHYAAELKPLFSAPYGKLFDFNLASVHWLKDQLHLSFAESFVNSFVRQYDGDEVIDLRRIKPKDQQPAANFAAYTQVFADRTGFIPNLSMLDLLFAEGPYAVSWLLR